MYDAKVDEKLTSIKYLYRLPPIADSRKGCPYEVRSLNFVCIFKRRTKFVPTICKTNFSEDFVPLSRHRCVEVAAPYKYASINCYNFRGWMISAPTYFDRSEITPQSWLRRASSPAGEPKAGEPCLLAFKIYVILNSALRRDSPCGCPLSAALRRCYPP